MNLGFEKEDIDVGEREGVTCGEVVEEAEPESEEEGERWDEVTEVEESEAEGERWGEVAESQAEGERLGEVAVGERGSFLRWK